MLTKAKSPRRSKPQNKPKIIPQLKKLTWDQFSLYVRLRDALAWQKLHPENNNGPMAPCISCSNIYPALGMGGLQAGHFIPGRRNAYLFDELQVNAQCYHCNMGLKGNWPSYYQVM